MDRESAKHALLVAYHYPPVAGSSGVQRTLSFSKYLNDHGWSCSVLTVHPVAYASTSTGQLAEIPEGVDVTRAWAVDAARHLSIAGRYPGALARPDRWVSWQLSAVPIGLSLIRRHRTSVIWSTYPIATAHRIASILAHRTGIAWVADFRDSMTEENYPSDPVTRRAFLKIEDSCVRNAERIVFTADGTKRLYEARYPEIPATRWCVIRNGFDEDSFARAEASVNSGEGSARTTLLHSGILYPKERNPLPFFEALSEAKREGALSADRHRIVLRATGHDGEFVSVLKRLRIDDIVELAPGVAYGEALREMLCADGLLLFQASNCNHQIPAKLYEYLRAQRPILALTDARGDTAATMRDCGLSDIADIESAADIKSKLTTFLRAIDHGSARRVDPDVAQRYSRRAQTKQLAQLFEQIRSA